MAVEVIEDHHLVTLDLTLKVVSFFIQDSGVKNFTFGYAQSDLQKSSEGQTSLSNISD